MLVHNVAVGQLINNTGLKYACMHFLETYQNKFMHPPTLPANINSYSCISLYKRRSLRNFVYLPFFFREIVMPWANFWRFFQPLGWRNSEKTSRKLSRVLLPLNRAIYKSNLKNLIEFNPECLKVCYQWSKLWSEFQEPRYFTERRFQQHQQIWI